MEEPASLSSSVSEASAQSRRSSLYQQGRPIWEIPSTLIREYFHDTLEREEGGQRLTLERWRPVAGSSIDRRRWPGLGSSYSRISRRSVLKAAGLGLTTVLAMFLLAVAMRDLGLKTNSLEETDDNLLPATLSTSADSDFDNPEMLAEMELMGVRMSKYEEKLNAIFQKTFITKSIDTPESTRPKNFTTLSVNKVQSTKLTTTTKTKKPATMASRPPTKAPTRKPLTKTSRAGTLVERGNATSIMSRRRRSTTVTTATTTTTTTTTITTPTAINTTIEGAWCFTTDAKPCVFPMKYMGYTWNRCVPHGGGSWCATSLMNQGSYYTYGYCDKNNCGDHLV